MGKAKNELEEFIANIPDSKLTGFPSIETTVYKTRNFRLDMQTVTTKDPRCYNLHVQINRGTLITSLKRFCREVALHRLGAGQRRGLDACGSSRGTAEE